MSGGVGVTGIISDLPNTVTPYPVIDPNLGLGGQHTAANAAARDAIPQNFRVIGMQVVLQDTGVVYQLVGGILNANWQLAGSGPQGAQGFQGLQGFQGAQGFQGQTGGAQGAQGAQGFQGSGGGAQGAQGGTGTQGFQGAQGFQGGGFQGATGAVGQQGFQGAAGAQGFQGAQGSQGFQGATGPQGAQGFQGAQGNQGFQGAQAGAFQLNPTGIQGLQAIPTSALASGTIADTGTVGDLYRLNRAPSSNETAGTDVTNIVAATSIAGNVWERLGVTNLNFAFVSAWFVDDAAGNDQNDGLTSGTALKTIEELCQRLCPGGKSCKLKQNTTVTVAAGSYGELSINLDSTFTLSFLCAFTSSASITLSAVVDTNATTLTRGELTTASGTFVNKRRIRSTSGAQSGALTYSTGLHSGATNTYIASWVNPTTFALVTVANGTTCVVDTLTVSFSSVQIQTGLTGTVAIHDAILSSCSAVTPLLLGTSIELIGCELAGYYTGSFGVFGCRTTNFIVAQGGPTNYAGTVFQQRIDFGQGGVYRGGGNTFDGAALVINGSGFAIIDSSTEWENGTISQAIAVTPGGSLFIVGKIWGASANYARGVDVSSGAVAIATSASLLAIPATAQVTLGGGAVTATYASVPVSLPTADSYFVLNSAPNGQLTASVYLTAQTAAIAATNFYSSNPTKGLYRVSAYLDVTTAGTALSTLAVKVNFTPDDGTASFANVTSPLNIGTIGGASGVSIIETNGSSQLSYEVDLTGAIGTGVYSLRIVTELISTN